LRFSLVNENETQPAYFDDFEITHKANPQKLTVSSWAEYYAFGKVAKASCPASGAYRYGYQGEFAEKDGETEWNSFELRQYDSEIGRWLSTDPYGQHHSPYLAMRNNPVNYFDKNGGWDSNNIGAIIGTTVAAAGAVAEIADGVGSRPCDWLAAQTACQKFIESLTLPLLPDSWEHSIRIIDQIVSNPPEECKGMMTTFVAVVWNLYENYVEFVSIGDSRIYLVKKNKEVIQLTKDESKAVNLRDKNGKLLLSGGYTHIRSGIFIIKL
jgi:RHS repeat-associated protein